MGFTPHIITGSETVSLVLGTYTVTQKNAHGTNIIPQPKTFTVTKDGVMVGGQYADQVDMVNIPSEFPVTFRLEDSTHTPIVGAKLSVGDTEWVTAAEDHQLMLEPGTYTLTETLIPEGWSGGTNVVFVVDDEGNVKVNDTPVDKVIMSDTLITHSVSVTLNVAGNVANHDKEFAYTATFTKNNEPVIGMTIGITPNVGQVQTDNNGQYMFNLTSDDSITISGIPYGTDYNIVQDDYTAEGYVTTYEGDKQGTIQTEDKAVVFTNTNQKAIPTSADTNRKIFMILFGLAFAAIAIMAVIKTRKRDEI